MLGLGFHPTLAWVAFSISFQILPPATPQEGWFELYDGDTGKHKFKLMELNGTPSDHHIALYDYNPRCKTELLMRQDDIVILHEQDKDWALVENAITMSQGYVPSSFVAPAASLESEAWFFGKITRSKAEKLLLNPMRKHGCCKPITSSAASARCRARRPTRRPVRPDLT